MSRRPSDALTAREREALDLIRLGLTNEEIAQRLDITLDGAKYHVSQILSKLGVATREDAAAVALGERPRWWAQWPLWAKIGSAATVTAAVAGLAVLMLSADEPEPEEVSTSIGSPDELYERVAEAIARQDFVFHARVRMSQPGANNEPPGPGGTVDYWLDATRDMARYELENSFVVIVVGGYVYSSAGSHEVEKRPVELGTSFCPGSTDPFVSALLWCAGSGTPRLEGTLDARIEDDSYEGQPAVVLVVEESYMTTLTGGSLPPPTGGTVPPPLPERSIEYTNVSRTYLNPDTFLPITRAYEIREDGEFHDASVVLYEHEFIAIGGLPDDFFDPASIGYTGEPDL